MPRDKPDPDETDVVAPRAGAARAADATVQLEAERAPAAPGLRLTVVEGSGDVLAPPAARFSIGSHELNDVVLQDATVSRFHCEVRREAHGVRVVDLKSSNGTFVDGVRVNDAFVGDGSILTLGRVALRFERGDAPQPAPPRGNTRFGPLVGASRAMRHALGLLEAAAASDATVLLTGETGTGKGRAAQALHEHGARKEGPFIVVDCGAVPATLLESELFGHEKGAFTGADARRIGAVEEASGGTLFLDEIGELPPALQPKLLRALENREIRRLGSNRHVPVDLRVIAATNRDLREAVNSGDFRPDLYFRLAVLTIEMPPLRDRPEDLPFLVDELLAGLGASDSAAAALRGPEALAELRRGRWPGNVRELRNHLEARIVLASMTAPAPPPPPDGEPPGPYSAERKRTLDAFEREYLSRLLRFHPRVADAAQVAGVDRVYLYRLLSRRGMKPPSR